jgi:hypothetical protein
LGCLEFYRASFKAPDEFLKIGRDLKKIEENRQFNGQI